MQTRLDKWDRRMLDLAGFIATWSKDPSTQVGAVITNSRHGIVSTGYNGPPRDIDESKFEFSDRDVRLAITIDAEENAILDATQALDGCTIYVSAPPCAKCAAKIIQKGIIRVVAKQPNSDFKIRWAHHLSLADSLYEQAGIVVDFEGGDVISEDELREMRKEVAAIGDFIQSSLRYDEEMNCYTIVCTKRQIQKAREKADEMLRKLNEDNAQA